MFLLFEHSWISTSQKLDPTVDNCSRKCVSTEVQDTQFTSILKTEIVESTIIICYIILITVPSSVVKYIALVVATACAGSAYPVIWPERIRALEGTAASGIGIGLTNAMAQFSGIAGPFIYSTVFGPTYRVSYIICLCFLCVAISGILASAWLVWRKDMQKGVRTNSGRDSA